MVPSKNTGAVIHWADAAPLVGLAAAGRALPAVAECPACGGRLHVYEDNTKAGAWHHCFGCGRQGDPVAFAAAVWGVGVEEAAEKLSRAGLPAEAERSGKRAARRKTVAAFWDGCRTALAGNPASDVLSRLRSRFRLTANIPRERWLAGPGLSVGCCTHTAAELCFSPKGAGPQPGRKALARPRDKGRLFHGGRWGDVLAVAYYDQPGRVCGFYFVGRGGGRDDRVSRKFAWATDWGLAGLPCVVCRGDEYGAVLAVGDPMVMCRMQSRHAATCGTPLPLVAWRDGTGRQAWRALGNRRKVLWAPTLTPQVVAHAVTADGWVYVGGPRQADEKAVDQYLTDTPPADLTRRAFAEARPWPEAVGRWADGATDAALEGLLLHLQGAGVDAARFARRLPGEAGRRALDLLTTPDSGRVVRVGRLMIEEKDGAWYYRSEGPGFNRQQQKWRLLSEIVVRIDQVVHDGRRKDKDTPATPIYEGRLLYHGKEYPFRCRASRFDSATPRMIGQSLLAAGVLGVRPASAHVVTLSTVAIAFQTPKQLRKRPDGTLEDF